MNRLLNSIGCRCQVVLGLRAGLLLLTLAGVMTPVWGQAPLYINNSSVTNTAVTPLVIDATAFDNRAEITTFSAYAFDTQNTLYYTNRASGVMTGYVGFTFEYVSADNIRTQALRFVNQGIIYGDSILDIRAREIINPGRLSVGGAGVMSVEGDMVNLSRGGLRSGQAQGGYYGGGRNMYTTQGTNGNYIYNDPPGVYDLYWGVGKNELLSGTNGQRLDVQAMTDTNLFYNPYYTNSLYPIGYYSFTQNFVPPFVTSPQHEVLRMFGQSIYTNYVQVPSYASLNSGNYTAYAYTNQLSLTSDVVQVVFVPNSRIGSNISVQVGFYGSYYGYGVAAVPIVEFSSTDYDVVMQAPNTNYVYLLDYSATLTNFSLMRYDNTLLSSINGTILNPGQTQTTTRTRRPNSYEVLRDQPYEWFYAAPSNTFYTPTMLYKTNFTTNVVDVNYAAYAVHVESASVSNVFADPSLALGAIHINANQLDLTRARIRADQFLSIKTTNLIGNAMASVDAPVVNYDLGTTNTTLTISNLAVGSVSRLSGDVFAWSAVWTNFAIVQTTNIFTGQVATATNTTLFHVLIVDNTLSAAKPVAVNELKVHATNLVVCDPLSVTKSLYFDVESLWMAGPNAVNFHGSSLVLPPGGNWNSAIFPKLNSLTNDGNIIIPGYGAFYHGDVSNPDGWLPYQNWVNHGMVTGYTHVVVANYLEQTGTLGANAGVISLDVLKARVTNGTITARSDIDLYAGDALIMGSTISSGTGNTGALNLSVSNNLSDGGPGASNTWITTGGFNLVQHPRSGDLFGTKLSAIAAKDSEVRNSWAGENRGASLAGFTNNTVIGHLVLDGGISSLLSFGAPEGVTNAALYVEYLELLNNATNYQTGLQIDPSLTIYFANANLPVNKLNGAQGGQLQWVPAFAGTRSSTNVVFPNGQVVVMNSALVASRDYDSNNNGIENARDPMPFSTILKVAQKPVQHKVTLSWNGLDFSPISTNSNNYIEYSTNLNVSPWLVLTNVVLKPGDRQLSVDVPLPAGNGMIYYRLRAQPQQP